MNILLLEDERTLNKHICKYLEIKGHNVDSFEDGLELIDNTNLYDYDFFIFDINVPNIDGFEILNFVRDKNIDVPTIIISARISIEDIKKAYSLGCSDYLKKPFELAELELRIDSILKQFHFVNIIEFENNYSYDLNTKQI